MNQLNGSSIEIGVRRSLEVVAALPDSEEQLRALLGTLADAAMLVDLEDGVLLMVNDAFVRLTGWQREEAIGRSTQQLELWRDPGRRSDVMARLQREGHIEDFDVNWRSKDGRVWSARIWAHVLVRPGRVYAMVVARDVDGVRRMEEELAQLRRVLERVARYEALGQLIGGVAHDFNNLLTIILAGADCLANDAAAGRAASTELIEEIATAGARGSELTRQLLDMARQRPLAPSTLELNTELRRLERMLQRALHRTIELVLDLHPQLWPVRGDAGQLEQILVNLLVNARHAMPDGGRLLVSTSNVILDECFAATHGAAQPGSYVRLAVSDTGVGMTSEVKAHLFEPFFTTKPVGQGSGLGLSTIQSIATQNGYALRVESELGRGTTFEVFFPRLRDEGQPAVPPVLKPVRTPRGGSETLLCIEPDAGLRAVLVRSLHAAGYRVHAAEDAMAALEIGAREPAGDVRLLVCSLRMADLDGATVAAVLRRRHTRLRGLYLVTHDSEGAGLQRSPDRGTELLRMPFTAGLMLARVRTLLDRPGSPSSS